MTTVIIPPRHVWTKNDLTLCACATLAGCKPDYGIVNTFNEMEEADEFVNCRTMGDYFRRWLAYLLADRRCQPKALNADQHARLIAAALDLLATAAQSAKTFEAVACAFIDLGDVQLADFGFTGMAHDCIARAKANRAAVAKAIGAIP